MKKEIQMTEREMFLEWLYDNTSYDHVYIRGEREEDGVFHSDIIQSLWKAWQASASRDGYKLVPCEKLEELKRDADRMIDLAHLYQDESHIKSFGRSFLHNYKDMMGVVE